ncbi:MAG: hypothetical protein KDC87_09940 [Planctomycetes bacterium]|nr:hypothetical protein [Planctomycetota bacterium]MCB9868471.1 hypothetical protein [Planctomycetota bacterium]
MNKDRRPDDPNAFDGDEEFILEDWDDAEREADAILGLGDEHEARPGAEWGDGAGEDADADIDEADIFAVVDSVDLLRDDDEDVVGAEWDTTEEVELADAEDLLFGDTSDDGDEDLFASDTPTFVEHDGPPWGGADQDLEELGVQMSDRPAVFDEDDEGFSFGTEVPELSLVGDNDDDLDDLDAMLDADLESDAEDIVAGIRADAAGGAYEPEGDWGDAAADDATGFDTEDDYDDAIESPVAGEFASDFGDEAETEYGAEAEAEYGADDDYDPGVDYGQRDFAASEDEDSEWAPVSAEQEDVEDAPVGEEEYDYEGQVPVLAGADEPDYADYEEAYHDDTAEALGAVIGAPRRRGSVLRWLSGLAAVLLVAAGTAVYLLKPEWLSMGARTDTIDVVSIDRPKVQVQLAPPVASKSTGTPAGNSKTNTPGKDGTTGPAGTGTNKRPTDTQVVKASKPPVKPSGTQPGGTGLPKGPESTQPEASGLPVAKKAPANGMRVEIENIQLDQRGSYLAGAVEHNAMEKQRNKTVTPDSGLLMGSSALAQLYNDNIFVGKVKSLDASYVTLRLETGEITLARAGIRTLTTLAAGEAQEWRRAVATGILRLRNNNRLNGQIVETRDDAVVLQLNANRVVVPRTAIEEVSEGRRKGIQFADGEELDQDSWFKNLVERRIQAKKKERDKTKNTVRVSAPGK